MNKGVSFTTLISLLVLFVLLPVIIYTFLVFPNFDGVMHNVRWYSYDDNSQHFLFWTGFWLIVLFGTRLSTSGSSKK